MRRKSGIKGIKVIVVETDTIICDPEADYGCIFFIEESLLALDVDPDAPGDFWFNVADRLRRIDYRLEQWKEWLPFRKARLANLVLKVDLDRDDGSLPSQGRPGPDSLAFRQPEQTISYVDYLVRCVRNFLQTMTLLRVELILSNQLRVRPAI